MMKIKDIYLSFPEGEDIVVGGWIRSQRVGGRGSITFVDLKDGSSPQSLQVVLKDELSEQMQKSGGTGASLQVRGTISRRTNTKTQEEQLELQVSEILHLGPVVSPDEYPLPKTREGHSVEHLRVHAHLRARTDRYSAIQRVRSVLSQGVHRFFSGKGFHYIHTPLITGADCEGAGEQFTVTTLVQEGSKVQDLPTKPSNSGQGEIDFSSDFFGQQTGLTVSGQLNVETHCMGMGDCYTFGPTFRAENSHTSKHLAEFWMVEPEIAFGGLDELIQLETEFIQFLLRDILGHSREDIEFLSGEDHASFLETLSTQEFARMTYTDAIAHLEGAPEGTFETPPSWGMDLGSEHEQYLAGTVVGGPVFVTNYPAGIKAFYMHFDSETEGTSRETVSATDLLIPRIGELCGGSQRETRFDVLETKCRQAGVNPESLQWYLDLRRFGSAPHSGFGLGFERLIMFVTGVQNIRDTIPFPRYPGHAEF